MRGRLYIIILSLAALAVPAALAQPGDPDVFIWKSRAEPGRPGPIREAWLGVHLREMTAEELKEWTDPDDLGVCVAKVVADSPAEKAGIQAGDVITHFAGIPVLGSAHLVALVKATTPGKTVTLTVYRGGKKQTIAVNLGKRKVQTEESEPQGFGVPIPELPEGFERSLPRQYRFLRFDQRPRLGIYYEDLTEQLGEYFGVPEGKGVLVTSVIQDSPAAKGGLQAGDVIVEIAGEKLESSEDLIDALADKDEGEALTIQAFRRGKKAEFKLTLAPEEKEGQGKKHTL